MLLPWGQTVCSSGVVRVLAIHRGDYENIAERFQVLYMVLHISTMCRVLPVLHTRTLCWVLLTGLPAVCSSRTGSAAQPQDSAPRLPCEAPQPHRSSLAPAHVKIQPPHPRETLTSHDFTPASGLPSGQRTERAQQPAALCAKGGWWVGGCVGGCTARGAWLDRPYLTARLPAPGVHTHSLPDFSCPNPSPGDAGRVSRADGAQHAPGCARVGCGGCDGRTRGLLAKCMGL